MATSAHFYKDPQDVFDKIDYQVALEPSTLTGLVKAFLDEFRVGLGSYNHPMAMIPSFVTGVPDGTETGTFLALDLGGTNLRVCEVVLKGDKTFTLRQQKYKVSEGLKTGEATVLFDYLAASVDAFLTSHPAQEFGSDNLDVIHLGLTFSFPVEQTALGSGKILTWTKGFSAKNAIGHDVVKLLQDAFDRKHMHVKCVALVNDTVGALLSRSYTAGGCILGSIFGTGTNGAYMEEVANITKLANTPAASQGGYMIVNTEWGAFNNSRTHLPFTPYDNAVDRMSINPRFQAFEKFISGMYLGEITRHILLSLIDAAPKPLLFAGKVTPSMNAQWGLDTSVMSDVEEAWEGKDTDDADNLPQFSKFDPEKLSPALRAKLERVQKVVVAKLGFQKGDVSLLDASIVRWVCHLVARRAALLSGVAVAAVLVQTNRATLPDSEGKFPKSTSEERIGVGVDGSLIQFYPNFERTMRESLRFLVGEEVEKRVDIGLAKDGSGVGAALCALQALKQM
ncbi:putative glucokinase [Moniliophthora roreri MCA 2997]|uniref:Phosphotransferase n=2 Tax=Moniliophthora roreri TaxID=221103 RepID=V2XLB5_MONRO|nr:putative glucokinase [Moniliophthora roreri MCA 2997]KAI3610977.1 putative glucokinase [Moniliophthora roreri]